MIKIAYTVEGFSLREFKTKDGNTIKGYKVYLSYPGYKTILHCDTWISERVYNDKPFGFGDVLDIAFDSKGKILDYDIQERSKVE